MAGRGRTKSETIYCPWVKPDGTTCGQATPPGGWDYCAVHAPRRGAQILKEVEERVDITVSVPRFLAPLGGLKRSEWEAIRILLCDVVLEPEMPDV